MKKINFHPLQSIIWGLFFIYLFFQNPVFAQETEFSDLMAVIPVDSTITKGTFDNGLTYYIKENKKPEKRALLWLVVNAGSVLEDEDQQGLAHFVEHMAFNGTKNFGKNEIIDYMESIGMQFGPEVNAYTSFDETVYMLEVPTDSSEYIEKGFQILEDWAHQISFDPEEIEKERGVIIEEWRLGRDAGTRMLDKQLPVIFKDSKYAERLPIGKKEIIENFDRPTLLRFYKDWYRPDLMAIIAVGDFDRNFIGNLIKQHFAEIPLIADPRKKSPVAVPDHDKTLFAIATDPEATRTTVELMYESDPLPQNRITDYRRMLIERLYSRILNFRLYELLNQAEPPFIVAYAGKTSIVRSKDIYELAAAVKENVVEKGISALLTEANRIRQNGVTQSELDRTKNELVRQYEQYYKERDKSNSEQFASEFQRNFLEGEPIPGISYEFRLAQEVIPGISIDEVNNIANTLMPNKNRVVLINAPEQARSVLPDEDQLTALLKQIDEQKVEAYVDEVSEKPLISKMPEPSKIKKEKKYPDTGIIEWRLSNGIRVILKPTDFKNDEIKFQGFSMGGTSLISDKDYYSAWAASNIVSLSGIGDFDLNSLNKKLTGKVVSVFPYIDELSEGVIGDASPDDMETMFQLIYLYMTSPRKDSIAFKSYLTRMKAYIENRSADPENAFYDTLMVTLAQHHPRRKPLSTAMLDQINFDATYDSYRERFADAEDFTFIFVGNFTPEKIKPFVTTYLGGLPVTKRTETWKDIGIHYPKGIIEKEVIKGIEPKSEVSMNFTGDAEWTRENNYILQSLGSVLDIKLREILREDKSGTYDVNVSSVLNQLPKQDYKISITFGCDPSRVEELTNTVFQVIDSLKQFGPAEIYITKVKEAQLRSYETNMKENTFWLRALQNYYFNGQDPSLILKYPELVSTLTSERIQMAVNRYLKKDNYVQVVLFPEGFKNSSLKK
jgi:zinc protease